MEAQTAYYAVPMWRHYGLNILDSDEVDVGFYLQAVAYCEYIRHEEEKERAEQERKA